MTLTLTEIATDTDKASAGHNYLVAYAGLFAPIRERVTSLLEIGVWAGDSLELWRQYFPNAAITGYDVTIRSRFTEGLELVELDAYTVEAVSRTPAQDIIIDDGPHTLESMLYAVAHYPSRLKVGGVMVVEDVKSPDWIPHLTQATPPELRHLTYSIDCRSTANTVTGDDIMFVIDRRFER